MACFFGNYLFMDCQTLFLEPFQSYFTQKTTNNNNNSNNNNNNKTPTKETKNPKQTNKKTQCVTVGTKTSSLSILKFGVLQGSVLGPILFSLYINDLPLYLKALCEVFADDTSLHNHHTNLDTLMNSLQISIDSLIDLTEMNHMALYPVKTKFMIITTRQKRQNLVPNLSLPRLTIKSDVTEEVQNHSVRNNS